jgi:prephenate dehydratase
MFGTWYDDFRRHFCMRCLGEMYAAGEGVPADIKKAISCSMRAAQRGNADAMVDVLEVFRRHGINLTNIDTRPSQKRNFEYYFFTDLVGHLEGAAVKTALEEARSHCLHLAVLGSFPRAAETL